MKRSHTLQVLGGEQGSVWRVPLLIPLVTFLLLPPTGLSPAFAAADVRKETTRHERAVNSPPSSLPLIDDDPHAPEPLAIAPEPPKPTQFFKSASKEVKPHGGRISLRNLDLSRPPSEEELCQAGQLGGRLSPSRSADPKKLSDPKERKEQEDDNLLFGKAMQKWNAHEYTEAVALFREHRGSHPKSPWAGEAQLHLGCQAQFSGDWANAVASFEWIIEHYEVGSDIWQKAMLRRAVLHYAQGELKGAVATFRLMLKSEKSWERRTYAQSMIRQINRARMHLASVRACGKESLAHAFERAGEMEKALLAREVEVPSEEGFSLGQLTEFAQSTGAMAEAVVADDSDPGKLTVPFVAHYSDGHYVVVEKVEADGTVAVFDPRLRMQTRLTRDQFRTQWSSFGIVLGAVPEGIRLADAFERNTTVGGCCGFPRYPEALGRKCPTKCCQGMPEWEVNPVNMNLVVQDIPIWHKSAYGPDFELALTYNSQDALNQMRPFGNKWVCNFGTYVMESPAQNDAPGTLLVVMPDGRGDLYTPNGTGGYNAEPKVHNTLTKLAGAFQFSLTFPDGTVYQYNVPAGGASTTSQLISITDRHGHSLNVFYDANGQIDYVRDSQLNQFDFSYNSEGLVSVVSDPWGRSATFTYTNDNLTGQTDMGDIGYSYTYDADVYLTSIGKPSGTWQFYIEPDDGTEMFDDGIVAYPAPGGVMWDSYRITITDPLGYKEEYFFNGSVDSQASGSFAAWHRDKVQYRKGVEPLSSPKTEFAYTGVQGTLQTGAITGMRFEDGHELEWTDFDPVTAELRHYVNERGAVVDLTYNSMGNPLTITDLHWTGDTAPTTTIAYEGNGVDVNTIRNHFNHLLLDLDYYTGTRDVEWAKWEKAAGVLRTMRFTYDALRRVSTITDPKGQLRTYVYYPSNAPTGASRLWKIHLGSDTGPILVQLTYDNIGRVASVTNQDGWTITFSRDGLDRVTSVAYPDFTTEVLQWGCCMLEAYTDRLGRSTDFEYDQVNRLIWQRDGRGVVTQFRYDPNGNLIKLIDGNGSATRWEYNGRNRMVKKIYADGTVQEASYDATGNPDWDKDAKGQTVWRSYDANNNLLDYLTRTPSGTFIRQVFFDYDDIGRLRSMKESGVSEWTKWDYNHAREVTNESLVTGPDGSETAIYSIAFDYNELGQRVSRTVDGSTAFADTAAYDNQGRLSGATNPLGTFTYSYVGGTTGVSRRLESISSSGGMYTQFGYHPAQKDFRLASIWHRQGAAGPTIEKYDYDYNSGGEITSWTIDPFNADPEQWTFNYDRTSQLMGALRKTVGTGTLVASRTYSYDNAGNRTREAQQTTAKMEQVPNSVNQITQGTTATTMPIRGVTNKVVQSVTINGNEAKLSGPGSSGYPFEGSVAVSPGQNTVEIAATDYQNPPITTVNQYAITVTGTPSKIYDHDDNGNRSAEGSRTYEWDELDRLIAINSGINRTEISYDGLGRRNRIVEKVNGAVTSDRQYVWAGKQLIEERANDWSNITRRYYQEGALRYSSAGVLEKSYHYGRDHLGSVRALCDANGTVQVRYDYDLFGSRSVAYRNGSAPDLETGFTGHWYHGTSGLSLALFRGYDSESGRWLTQDPMGENAGLNLYQYVFNSPVSLRDPDGRFAILGFAVGGAALGGGFGGLSDFFGQMSVYGTNWHEYDEGAIEKATGEGAWKGFGIGGAAGLPLGTLGTTLAGISGFGMGFGFDAASQAGSGVPCKDIDWGRAAWAGLGGLAASASLAGILPGNGAAPIGGMEYVSNPGFLGGILNATRIGYSAASYLVGGTAVGGIAGGVNGFANRQ